MTERAATLTAFQIRLAVDAIRSRVAAQGRAMTPGERRTLEALLPRKTRRAPEKPSKAPEKGANDGQVAATHSGRAQLPMGHPVLFQSTGRLGKSPARKGTVFGYHETGRGTWMIVAEDGAALGIVVRVRPTLVRPG